MFDRLEDTETVAEPVGCMIFHDIHNHYHFEDFAQYDLYRVNRRQAQGDVGQGLVLRRTTS